MNVPDKIYTFQDDGDRYWYKPEEWETPPLTRVEYIRKDALLEWAKTERAKCSDETHPYAQFMNVVIDKLNSL